MVTVDADTSAAVEWIVRLSAVIEITPLPDVTRSALAPTVTVSNVTDSERFVLNVMSAFRLSASVPASPWIISEAPNAASTLAIVIVSLPVPALIISEPVGFAKVTDSPSVESIVMAAPAASVSVIVSQPPLNVNTRSIAERLSAIGSRST